MKVRVNQDACIGCSACEGICEKVFKLNDEGISEVKNSKNQQEFTEVAKEDIENVKEAIDCCPTGAIEGEE